MILFKKEIENYTIILYSDGSIFKGKGDKNNICLKGIHILNNGDVYVGEFNNNTRGGKGILIHKSGTLYKGEFKNGKKEGKGIFIKSNNDFMINCNWLKDKMDDSKMVNILTDKNYYKGTIKINNGKTKMLNGFIT